jgi:hypothetical protein
MVSIAASPLGSGDRVRWRLRMRRRAAHVAGLFVAKQIKNCYFLNGGRMRKSPHESWLFYLSRCLAALSRDSDDWKYWANVFATAGAASLAVAFIQGDSAALIAGIAFCLYGLRFNRRK